MSALYGGNTGGNTGAAARILRVPLAFKLVGANALIALVAWLVAFVVHRTGTPNERTLVILAVALAVAMAVNLVLVTFALRPIRDLERTARRIRNRDPRARVPRSPVGDAELDHVGATLNALLDDLDQDRIRLHRLATEVIRAEDRERARIGRELHDSIAQSLAAIAYQLTAAEKDSRDPTMGARIRTIRVLAGRVLDEIDVLSHTVHPRVLNDLGVLAGLRHLARTVGDAQRPVDVRVSEGSDDAFRGLGMDAAAVLYRVAQAAIQNAIRHSHARRIEVILGATDAGVSMCVVDDGDGFDLAGAQARRPGMGLFTMAERVALVNGEFGIDTSPGRGTTVRVRIPVDRDTFNPAAAQRP